MTKKYILLFLFAVLSVQNLYAQYPQHFTYDDENGLPSNEVYSILQDRKGFLWFGCDAGLYKFDGVRYTNYTTAAQNSTSVTGLTLSASGRLYCYNFQSRIFYLENDTLKELHHAFSKINNITADRNGNIWATHTDGISMYNETSKTWTTFTDFGTENKYASKLYSNSVKLNGRNEICFLNTSGIGVFTDEKLRIIPMEDFKENPPGRFVMESWKEQLFILATNGSTVYESQNNSIKKSLRKNLLHTLQNKKVTHVKALADGMLWICTYNGIIRYNPEQDEATLYYPNIAFSDVLIDREGNYWFSTLQTGIFRVPDLELLVWNVSNDVLKNDKLTKISNDETHIYFATVNGYIGQLNTLTNELKIFHTGSDADIQCLEYEFDDKRLYFYIGRNLYALQNEKVTLVQKDLPSLKAVCKAKSKYFLASSTGIFTHSLNETRNERFDITKIWTREVKFDSLHNTVYAATNSGLLKLNQHADRWIASDTFFTGKQIQSFDYDAQYLFVLLGSNIFSVDKNDTTQLLATLPKHVQAHKLKYHHQKIFLATNKGVWIFDLQKKQWQSLNRLSGLASDNVQGLTILENDLWLATGKGLQKIPLNYTQEKPLAKVYLKNSESYMQLHYGQSLALYPEASIYNANGNFEFAYRIGTNDWVRLPATVEQIEIQNLPAGNFEIALKAIDHKGRDSENIVSISGYVIPPFWKTWWFVALIISAFAVFTFLIVKRITANIRKREHEKTALIHSELTALKAQMNPHFMYNALNSIQALILKQDIKNSNLYLSQFSSLMRKVLDVSGKEEISLQEETDILQLYLSLEKLRFGNDFKYEISVSAEIDICAVSLPPLILQPFVENAVKHGLLHKKGEKTLRIDFRKENSHLLCSIADNGIGRKRAQQIKERQHETHESFSTHATRKRVALLNSVNGKKIELEINDLYNNEQPSGTEVILIVH